ncbi:WD40-repeat-containing domain protein [Scenedesmus sp. NREL 46B-D3]|nr:WD40-repeat-containing domain protein [Scenedesmus sp. NREL 46B-D3]
MTGSVFDSLAGTCFGHTGRVFGLAYHPCSHQILASASEDETVRVWSKSTPTGSWQQASCCRGHTSEVLRVAWSPNGMILASGSADHTVRLWQVGTQGHHSYSGVELAVLSGHPEEVYGLKFMSNNTGNTSASSASSSAAAAAGTSWLAGACADGMLRLWDAGQGRLQEVAAVRVHVGDMGSVCSFVPQQPWLVLTISKSGQLVLQDIRLLGQALLAQQLQGPVYDMAWTVQQQQMAGHPEVASGHAVAGAAAAAAELQLCVVGSDSNVRSYAFSREALLAGHLAEPGVQAMPEPYSGRLLALASTSDGRALAAAGEAVPAATLQPAAAPQQQQQQQQQQQESPQGVVCLQSSSASSTQASRQTCSEEASAATAVAEVAGAAVTAAAAVPAVARRRKGRNVRPAAAVDLFNMTDDDTNTGDGSTDNLLLQMQQQQMPRSNAGSSRPPATIEGGAAGLAADDAAAGPHMPACAAAAAGILMRAPLFTWTNA